MKMSNLKKSTNPQNKRRGRPAADKAAPPADTVFCPYCGAPMMLDDRSGTGMSYVCTNCLSRSPIALFASDAAEVAQQRVDPVQKPLSMAEVREVAGNLDSALWLESKNGSGSYVQVMHINGDTLVYQQFGFADAFSMRIDPTFWRFWRTKPSDAAQKAARWGA